MLESMDPVVGTRRSAIERFIKDPETSEEAPLKRQDVTQSMMPVYLYFYYTFIMEKSPMKGNFEFDLVEIVDAAKLIKDINACLESRSYLKVNVFDAVMDQVLEKLYAEYTSIFDTLTQYTK